MKFHKIFLINFTCLLIILNELAYPYYKIHDLSTTDGVFRDFREEILFHNTQLLYRRQVMKKSDQLNPYLKLKMAIYQVKKEDTLESIANKAYLDVDTIGSINSLSSSLDINEGKEILIPNMKGSIIDIETQTDIGDLSRKYQIPDFILQSINNLDRSTLYQGERIFIPFRKLSSEEKKFFSGSVFLTPIASGRLTSGFGYRRDPFKHFQTFHGGLDIAAITGTAVHSSQEGKIIFSGWAGGYGQLVIVEHKYHYKTFYGHLSKILVKKGDSVKQGQVIGNVGSTGRSTGPHLHYEIRRFDILKNPLSLTHFE